MPFWSIQKQNHGIVSPHCKYAIKKIVRAGVKTVINVESVDASISG